jgi:thiol-disulfide isomerase/thioredoxin
MKSVMKMFRAQPVLMSFTTIAVLGLVIFLLMQYQKTSYTAYNSEGFQLTPVKAHYYYMDGCGHCKDFSPIWDEFTQSYKGKVQFQKINMKDAEEDVKKYKVEGFPTVVVIDSNDKFEHYNGERTVAGLQSYFG